jgi:hypothetical protein
LSEEKMKSKEVCKRKSGVNQKGASLVIALMLLLILTLIGIAALQTTTHETNIAGNERLYNRSFYSADAGIDYFYATSDSYISLPTTGGTIDSTAKGVSLGTDRFAITWQKIGEEQGPPRRVNFLVTSVGTSPSLPTAGRVTIEVIMDGVDLTSSTIDPQGGGT